MADNLPEYEDVPVESEINEAHEHIDSMEPEQRIDTYDYSRVEDEPVSPETLGTVLTKYRVEAEVPFHQQKAFEVNKAFHGRHVALSNTKRMDNLRHLDAQDLCNNYDRIAILRHRAVQIRMRETGEFQMCRSNEEVGGFEAKIGVTHIRKEDVDVKQSQSLYNNPSQSKKRRGFLSFLARK